MVQNAQKENKQTKEEKKRKGKRRKGKEKMSAQRDGSPSPHKSSGPSVTMQSKLSQCFGNSV